jgi:hypothetical protein
MISGPRSRKVAGRVRLSEDFPEHWPWNREPPAGLGAVAQHADEEESNYDHQ